MKKRHHHRNIGRRDFLRVGGLGAGAAVLASCAPGAEPGAGTEPAAGERVVYTELYGGEWEEHFTKNAFLEFEEETGIQAISVPGAGSKIARVDAMVKSDKVEIDLLATDLSDVLKGTRLNIWQKLNETDVPNLKTIESQYRMTDDFSASYELYWMIMFSMPEHIAEKPDSWEALWDPKYKGWVSAYNDPGWSNIFPIVGATLGIDQEMLKDPNQLEKVWDKLSLLKDQIKRWWVGGADFQQMVAADEAWIGEGWNGRIFGSQAKGVNIDAIWPKEGAYLAMDQWVITKGTPRLEEAYALLDFLLRPEQQASFAVDTGYGGSVDGLIDLLDEETRYHAYGPPGATENAILEDWEWYIDQAAEIEERWTEWIAG